MIEHLGAHRLLAGLFANSDRGYGMGPSFFRAGHASVARFLSAAPELDSAERAFLVGKLREHNWNISKTAEVIGTPRSNLYKKLEQYGITQENDG